MSCLIRRTALDDAGGLKAFGGYLAEDYFIAEQVQKKVRAKILILLLPKLSVLIFSDVPTHLIKKECLFLFFAGPQTRY